MCPLYVARLIDAPNNDNAYSFLDYLMKPQVIAACTDATGYANANKAANKFVNPKLLSDPAIYPDAETMTRLWIPKPLSAEQQRVMTLSDRIAVMDKGVVKRMARPRR